MSSFSLHMRSTSKPHASFNAQCLIMLISEVWGFPLWLTPIIHYTATLPPTLLPKLASLDLPSSLCVTHPSRLSGISPASIACYWIVLHGIVLWYFIALHLVMFSSSTTHPSSQVYLHLDKVEAQVGFRYIYQSCNWKVLGSWLPIVQYIFDFWCSPRVKSGNF